MRNLPHAFFGLNVCVSDKKKTPEEIFGSEVQCGKRDLNPHGRGPHDP